MLEATTDWKARGWLANPPSWSLRGLRLLVGHAVEAAPEAVAAFTGRGADPRTSRCRLLFDAIALALAAETARCSLDGLLAPLLAPEAARFAGRPLCELAALPGREPLPPHHALALIWLLGRHPSWAARRLEERVSLWLDLRLAGDTGAASGPIGSPTVRSSACLKAGGGARWQSSCSRT